MTNRPIDQQTMRPTDQQTKRLTRRDWLKWSAVIGAGVIASACGPASNTSTSSPASDSSTSSPSSGSADATSEQGSQQPNDIGLGDQVHYTANKDFYIVDIGAGHPQIDAASWRLALDGKVNTPLKLSLDDIKALPSVTQTRTFECISNPVGGPLIGNGVWVGVRMKDLLAQAGMQPSARELVVRSADGFHTSIPIALAMDDNALLVYSMTG